MAKPRPKLNDRQKLFIKEYLLDLNATQAAIRAGYSKKCAGASGNEILKNPAIQKEVRAAIDERAARTGVTVERVIREIAHMALIDVTEFAGIKEPKDLKKLPENIRRAIVGWSWSREGKFQPKTAKEGSIEMLGRHLGLFDIGDQGEPTQELNDAIQELEKEENKPR